MDLNFEIGFDNRLAGVSNSLIWKKKNKCINSVDHSTNHRTKGDEGKYNLKESNRLMKKVFSNDELINIVWF